MRCHQMKGIISLSIPNLQHNNLFICSITAYENPDSKTLTYNMVMEKENVTPPPAHG